MGIIKILNQFRSVPLDIGGTASAAWFTKNHDFISNSDIITNIVSPNPHVGMLAPIQTNISSNIQFFDESDFINEWTITRNDNDWLAVTDESTLDYITTGSPSLPLEHSTIRADLTMGLGQFDIQFEYDVPVATGATSGNYLRLMMYRQSDARNVCGISWLKVGTPRIKALYNHLTYGEVTIENTGGKFRIRRDSDNIFWVYYDFGSGWEWDGDPNGFNPWSAPFDDDDIYMLFDFQQGNGNAWSGQVSNLITAKY